jgi:catechol-2,3-dioxygenase
MAAPSKFAHVVYQTHRFEEMIDWYRRVFEATVRHKDDKLAFLSYDDEHHRMAFLNLGPIENGGAPKKASGVGVHHVAYTWKDLGELVDTYKRLKSYGVLPTAPIRHGLTLSLYYQDPDALRHIAETIDECRSDIVAAVTRAAKVEALNSCSA